jgi:enoyl reductase-like protein
MYWSGRYKVAKKIYNLASQQQMPRVVHSSLEKQNTEWMSQDWRKDFLYFLTRMPRRLASAD